MKHIALGVLRDVTKQGLELVGINEAERASKKIDSSAPGIYGGWYELDRRNG